MDTRYLKQNSGFSKRANLGPWLSHLGFLCGSAGNAGDLDSIPGLGRSLGEGKATHSSILVKRMPWTV